MLNFFFFLLGEEYHLSCCERCHCCIEWCLSRVRAYSVLTFVNTSKMFCHLLWLAFSLCVADHHNHHLKMFNSHLSSIFLGLPSHHLHCQRCHSLHWSVQLLLHFYLHYCIIEAVCPCHPATTIYPSFTPCLVCYCQLLSGCKKSFNST